MLRFLILLLTPLLFVFATPSYATTSRFLLVSPGSADNPHWQNAVMLAQQAACQLNVELQVGYVSPKKRSNWLAISSYIDQDRALDGVIFMAQPTEDNQVLFSKLEQHAVPYITLENSLPPEAMASLETHKSRYPRWLAHLSFDDVQAGYLLAKALIERAKASQAPPYQLIALSGAHIEIARQRNKGLHMALGESPDVTLNQLIYTNWDPERSRSQTLKLLKRYPETNIIWAASDKSALGAQQALGELGIKPHQQMALGGIDWQANALKAIKKGEYSASVGGHVLLASYALVELFDAANGADPQSDSRNFANLAISHPGQTQAASMATLSRIDFRALSRALSPDKRDHQLTMDKLQPTSPTLLSKACLPQPN